MTAVTDADAIAAAWIEAGGDLDIAFQAPFELTVADVVYRFIGRVPDFGARHGMLICSETGGPSFDEVRVLDLPSLEYGYSFLRSSYCTYDRELFIDTLNDWQWINGAEDPPGWYTGAPWT